MMVTEAEITRIRVRYAKGDSLRFTGHLDLQRLWERALRRSKLPIRYSQGYHRRARLNLASALPLGFVSNDERLDFWMDEFWPLEVLHERLTSVVPAGITILSLESIPLHEPALQVQMKASEFEVTFYDPQDSAVLARKVEGLLEQEEIIITRRKRRYDLWPLILELEAVSHNPDGAVLRMQLQAEPGATGRPDDVLDTLGFPNTDYLVRRTRLILA